MSLLSVIIVLLETLHVKEFEGTQPSKMPPKDDKGKKPPPKPECVAPAEAQPPDEMSPEFYLNQIAELEVGVERWDTYNLPYTAFVTSNFYEFVLNLERLNYC